MDNTTSPKPEYGVTPTEVMASMSGLDFVRAMFGGKLPPPPIMQTIGHVTPQAWAMDAWLTLIWERGGVAAIAGPLAVLAGFAVVLGILATWRLRRSLTA